MIFSALINLFKITCDIQIAIAGLIVGLEPFRKDWEWPGVLAGKNTESLGQFECSLQEWREEGIRARLRTRALNEINGKNKTYESIYHTSK